RRGRSDPRASPYVEHDGSGDRPIGPGYELLSGEPSSVRRPEKGARLDRRTANDRAVKYERSVLRASHPDLRGARYPSPQPWTEPAPERADPHGSTHSRSGVRNTGSGGGPLSFLTQHK